MLSLFSTLKGYNKKILYDDFSAGLTTAFLLIPQSMAYAMIAGLPPIIGLYSAIIPCAIYAFLGTSRQLSVGPVAIISIIVAASLGDMHLEGQELVSNAIMLTFISGILLFLFGLFRIGFIETFLSHSVLSGFTSAAALVIGLSQTKHLLGLDLETHKTIFGLIFEALSRILDINIYSFIIGIGSILLIITIKKINKKIPCTVVTLILSILIVKIFNLTEKGVAIVGDIPSALPVFDLSFIQFNNLPFIVKTAFTIAIVGFMESIAIAKSIASRTRTSIDSNKELLALGAANVVGSFFSSYPVTGGFSRTAVNYDAGAKTGVASLFTASLVALAVVYFSPFLYFLPKATLAAVIMVAVFGLFDFKSVISTYKIKKSDSIILILTFFATLLIGIEQGIIFGVLVSFFIVIRRTIKPHMAVLGRMPSQVEIYRNIDRYDVKTWPHIRIMRLDAPLYFANAGCVQNKIINLIAEDNRIRHFILDASGINDLDSTGEETLRDMIENLHKESLNFYIVSAIGPFRDVMIASGLNKVLGDKNLFLNISQAMKYIEEQEEISLIMD